MNRIKNMGIDHRLYSRELRNLEIKIAERDKQIEQLKKRLEDAQERAEAARTVLEAERVLIRAGVFLHGAEALEFTISGRLGRRVGVTPKAQVDKELHLAAVAYKRAVADAGNAIYTLCPHVDQDVKFTGLEQILSDE